ncbi:uncharacterized protein At5g08430-like isoform X2 [Malania oleifera]|uniref:uncharacterized protein At5g08430-like isoform X2 n=1 Tax=Malania oleifera TaxID=397392 RepID=UPI0025AE896C|nr:uncharacterized protein At5g08430-like isoform X2 [Malania oleifera]
MKKRRINKEEVAEDFCFHCKDGGSIRICDYKDCLKAYHPSCVGREESFLEGKGHWKCEWHSCFICGKASKFYCYCCPRSICGRCIGDAEFAHVRRDKGFCVNCLKLALLVEEEKDVDSDGGKIDFKDRDTVEFLFMEYWDIIKEKEGLTVTNLRSADALLKKNQSFISCADLDENDGDEEENMLMVSDYDDKDDIAEHKPAHKRKICKGRVQVMNKKVKNEFIGWGSRPLIEFLESIGKDASSKLSQYDVTSIINSYIHENKLFHPEKKKVICDARLHSVLGRKVVKKNRIYDLLEAHFAENLEESEEEEVVYGSLDKENFLVAHGRHRNSNADKKSWNNKVVLETSKSCFASLVAQNIKLVYLKRSLVEELLKQPDTFEGKVMGTFVRVKSDPNDYMQRNSHQLVQVTGVKKNPKVDDLNAEILLQVTNVPNDVHICMLSDSDFSEEEGKHLHQKVKDGLLRRPTVVELQQKAQSLHEDITKHWIVRELALLQNLIDRANEKGWRRELFEYMERRQLLQTSSEQLRLLRDVPKVIAEVTELELASEDYPKNDEQGCDDLTKSALARIPKNSINNSDDKESSTFVIGSKDNTVAEEKQQSYAVLIPEEKSHHYAMSILEENRHQSESFPEEQIQHEKDSVPEEQMQEQSTNPEQFMVKDEKALIVPLIELSDDEKEGPKAGIQEQIIEDLHSSIWYCIGPYGKTKGPYSLSLLKRWVDCSSYASKFKVWKMGESQEKAISLTKIMSQIFAERS